MTELLVHVICTIPVTELLVHVICTIPVTELLVHVICTIPVTELLVHVICTIPVTELLVHVICTIPVNILHSGGTTPIIKVMNTHRRHFDRFSKYLTLTRVKIKCLQMLRGVMMVDLHGKLFENPVGGFGDTVCLWTD